MAAGGLHMGSCRMGQSSTLRRAWRSCLDRPFNQHGHHYGAAIFERRNSFASGWNFNRKQTASFEMDTLCEYICGHWERSRSFGQPYLKLVRIWNVNGRTPPTLDSQQLYICAG